MSCPLDPIASRRGTLDAFSREAETMARSRQAEPPRARRKRRHRRNADGRLEIPYDPELDDRSFLEELESARRGEAALPSRLPDAAALADDDAQDDDAHWESEHERVRAIAERKAELTLDAAKKGAIVLVLLLVPPLTWLGFILLLVWGIRLSRRYFRLLVEPGLRERIIEDEVQKQVHRNVSQERRSLQGEHSRGLEELSASIAHEIRNPITAAKSLVQQMREEPASEHNAEYARVAVEELERVERSITHLLRFAREEEMRVSDVSMADVLESALETFRERAVREGVEISRQFDTDGVVQGDADKLRRIVINLVGNAMDALAEARLPSPRIEVSMGENLAGTEVWVRVADNGVGIPEAVRKKIFSPFVTSKSGGTGLGLAISKKLVEAHAGSIEVSSEPGNGTEFLLTIPKRTRSGRSRT